MDKPRIGIVIGSTRRVRFGERPARWLLELAQARGDADYALFDLRDYPMPFFDEASPPAAEAPKHPVAQRWQAQVGGCDGFVFVTAEYNHGIPAVLKNALDHAYAGWNRKAAGFMAYGGVGGARAVEQLRLTCIELQLAPLRNAVHIGRPEFGELRQGKDFGDFPALQRAGERLLDDVLWWARALKAARQAEE